MSSGIREDMRDGVGVGAGTTSRRKWQAEIRGRKSAVGGTAQKDAGVGKA
jgi:hypothetical protein